MGSQQVLDNFESLWFFATIFSSRTPPSAVEKLQNPTQNDAVKPIGEEIATPILEIQPNVDEIEKGSEMKTEEKRKNRIRKRYFCWKERRKIVGEMDVSYVVKEICECLLLFEEKIGKNYYQKKMPSFEDNMAMKEHIRSWAYAVACTVT